MKKFIWIALAWTSSVFAIDTRQLKEMMDTQVPFVLLDARGDHWNIPQIIPGAKFAGSDFSEERLAALVPEKSSTIVVYGFSATCPKARMLVEKLTSLGYTNIMEYYDGLEVWREDYPVDEIK